MNAVTTNNLTTSKKFTKDLADINNSTNLIDGVCLTACIVSGSCGESTIPKELVSLQGVGSSKVLKGTKIEWFPKDALKFVNATSTGTKAILSKYGVRFGDMTLIPIDKLDDCMQELKEAELKFNSNLQSALDEYDELIQRHKSDNPGIDNLIDDFKLPKDQFESRFKFKVLTPLAMTPLFEDDQDALASDIAETLYDEIAAMATKIYYKSIFDKKSNGLKDRISGKVKSSLKAVYNKMASLAFLDHNIIKLLEDFRNMLKDLPKSGYIEGSDRNQLAMFTLLLGDAEKLQVHGTGINQLQSLDLDDDSDDDCEIQTMDDLSIDLSTIHTDQEVNEVADLW